MRKLLLLTLALASLAACGESNKTEAPAHVTSERLYITWCDGPRDCENAVVPDGADGGTADCDSHHECKWRTKDTGDTQDFQCVVGEALKCPLSPSGGGYRACVASFVSGVAVSTDWSTTCSSTFSSSGVTPAWVSVPCRGVGYTSEDCSDSAYVPAGTAYDPTMICATRPDGDTNIYSTQDYCVWRVDGYDPPWGPSNCLVGVSRFCTTSGFALGIQDCLSVGDPEDWHTDWNTCHT